MIGTRLRTELAIFNYAKEDVFSRIDYLLVSQGMVKEWDPTEDNEFWRDSEKDAEWKSLHQAPTNIAFDNRVELRMDLNPVESVLNGG